MSGRGVVEKLLLAFELLLPFVRFDRKEFAHRFARDVELSEIEIFRTRDGANLAFPRRRRGLRSGR